MKKYLALYMAPLASFDKAMKMTEEESKPMMEAWNSWMERNKKSLPDLGAPLGKSKKVTKAGIEDVRNTVGGYSIVQAESLEEAAKLFSNDHPHFMMDDAWVEVIEFVDMPEM